MNGTRISSLLGKITTLFVICCCCLSAQGKYGGGTGEMNDPYLIYTAEQMNEIGLMVNSGDWDKHFKLMADIDLSSFTGTSFNIIGTGYHPFTGVFDGSDHTITNFTYTSTGTNYIGLFGYVRGENAEIKNLGLINPNVDAGTGNHVGSLVGRLRTGTITNCYVEGGSVTGEFYVGGLVGFNHVFCPPGLCSGGMISNCYATSSVSGNYWVGGLVGGNYGTISNCYATGDVAGVDDGIGGLVGSNWYGGTINNCYSTGSVSGHGILGGLLGEDDGTVINSFWDIETSEQSTSAGGTGKTTAEMQTASTFALVVWGCGSVWTIDEGKDYPRLWWENAPGELITTPSYGGGNGEPNDPYLIYTAEQLNTIGLVPCHFDKHFLLCADIDLSSFTGTSFNIIGTYWAPFTGVFDGNGHTISNFTCTSYYFIGLFGCVNDPNAEIKNLGLIAPNVDGGTGNYVGSLIGQLSGGNISNCYVEGGSVEGVDYVGGLVGSNRDGTITNCYVEGGSVSGNKYVGGLVGENWSSTVANCYSTASVTGGSHVGGLVGSNWSGTITNCYSTGNASGGVFVGGLVGLNTGYCVYGPRPPRPDICYFGTISNCYSTGSVTGVWNVGGLIGRCYKGVVKDSFWDIETSGRLYSSGGIGKTTAEMQTMSTFTDAGWDFVGETVKGIEDIWFIPQQDYPHLWWEGIQVPMKLTPRTLNCRSYGDWVKAHLTLPEGFTVADVDPDRPAVLHSFGFESAPLYVFVNKDKLVEIEAAFERQKVCSLADDWPQMLTVAGFLADGNIFLGTSSVRIIHPGMKVIEELAWYWLNADCVHPDFCNQIDMNRDSLVNLLDYALLMNINVEFVAD